MDSLHRTNVFVTSCLRPPVDPQTKAPLALYGREKDFPYETGHTDTRQYEREEYDSDSDVGSGEVEGHRCSPLTVKDYGVSGPHSDLQEFYLSNEEYYRKLDELKKAHLQTMAELEGMYQHKLVIKDMALVGNRSTNVPHRLQWTKNCSLPVNLCKAESVPDLNHLGSSGMLDTYDNSLRDRNVEMEPENYVVPSPNEMIKNMWKDFIIGELTPENHPPPSLSSRPMVQGPGALQEKSKGKTECWKPRNTVPKPFQMMLREAEKKQKKVKSRLEGELENARLRKQLEELTECQKKFRASPVPAHVYRPLYKEICEHNAERRSLSHQRRTTSQKPFSFLERECQKKERQIQLQNVSAKAEKKVFRARPVPRSVYDSTASKRLKEDQLYRAIRMQMRAQELLHCASLPCSMLAQRLSNRRHTTEERAERTMCTEANFRPKIKSEVPDFDASYQRFRKWLQDKRDVKLMTVCEPFRLRTAQIRSHHERILADVKAEEKSPRVKRRPYSAQSYPAGFLLSGSQELLPAKVTDAAKKRQEAVRRVFEQKKKAEEEEEKRREKLKERERKLQKVIIKRALANDPHTALFQVCPSKLKQFRKQDRQRRKEYQEEIREMQERLKERPLLLEQVTQKNARQAAEKRFAEAIRGYGLTEGFINSKASKPPLSDRSLESFSSFTKNSSNKEEDVARSFVGADSLPDDYPEDFKDFNAELGGGEEEEEGENRDIQKDIEEKGNRADYSDLHGERG